ncbi:Methylmalonyl-CoA mutase auxilliary protein, metallochaperone [Paraburkholderia dioscoreae]|uniref:Methylmalonyl-CoA mutase auxilliary protein, metallochaperone n=1 Tax=Paraburkholderia dioscoreae TaxID=2604047 RepID=A0A5Q4ZJ62_9BURK|nr:Methylmalonyl-CoA mutase auxilliary protein, metallochaperone [Paraburkholderia dioscoreae]
MSVAGETSTRDPADSRVAASARGDLARRLSRISRATVSESLRVLRTQAEASARRIGFTGPPGAGKSTLIARLAKARAARGESLAIIAIDPSSPKTSGALLGDRVRMDALLADTDVYIRSLPSGRSADGLSDNLADVLAAVEAEGFAEILVETVGVGQVEYGARTLVDTLVLTMGPHSGDQVQAMKAGVLETADIVVVNKADLPGAERMAQDIGSVLERNRANGRRVAPVLLAAANDAESVERLSRAIDEHTQWREQHVSRQETGEARALFHTRSLLNRRIGELIETLPSNTRGAPVADIYSHVVRLLNESG